METEVLERHYQIRCGEPELINRISRLVNDQAASIRRHSTKADISDLDIMVQVAFRLAVSLYHGRQELTAVKNQVEQAEDRLEKLTRTIEQLLSPQ
ncbi:MAG: cell division protein ZapA [Deltaproteobacteria bacterium]|nr:cell division protein ZapA [Deltaproteobacteria bacterium]